MSLVSLGHVWEWTDFGRDSELRGGVRGVFCVCADMRLLRSRVFRGGIHECGLVEGLKWVRGQLCWGNWTRSDDVGPFRSGP